MATKATQSEKPRVVPAQKGARAEAFNLIFRPLARGDGFRHVAIGGSGWGKTHHIRAVVDEALALEAVDLALTHDVKGAEPEYDGLLCAQVAEVLGQLEHIDQHRHLVFRGDPRADVDCPVDQVAELGKSLSRADLHVLLNIGELDEALTDSGRAWTAPAARWFFSQGRKLRACVTATVQDPKRVPDDLWNLSSSTALFFCDVRASNYLGQTLMLDERLVATLPELGVGDFVLREQGRPWDGKIYRF